MSRFSVIDIETANPDVSSICQIGVAVYENETLVDTWTTLVNPESYFRDINISIHGINESHVLSAPKRNEIIKDITKYLHNCNVASYGAFDRSSINRAYPNTFLTNWLDVTFVVRRTYENLSKKGYGLGNVCSLLDIDLKNHHDALSDAIAAGEVLIKAARDGKTPIEKWFTGYRPRKFKTSANEIDVNVDGHLYGNNIVFTGTLSVSRTYAENVAKKLGCEVGRGVTKNTNILVVGEQDLFKTKGSPESAKEKKARELIQSGQEIQILYEDDFFKLIENQDLK